MKLIFKNMKRRNKRIIFTALGILIILLITICAFKIHSNHVNKEKNNWCKEKLKKQNEESSVSNKREVSTEILLQYTAKQKIYFKLFISKITSELEAYIVENVIMQKFGTTVVAGVSYIFYEYIKLTIKDSSSISKITIETPKMIEIDEIYDKIDFINIEKYNSMIKRIYQRLKLYDLENSSAFVEIDGKYTDWIDKREVFAKFYLQKNIKHMEKIYFNAFFTCRTDEKLIVFIFAYNENINIVGWGQVWEFRNNK